MKRTILVLTLLTAGLLATPAHADWHDGVKNISVAGAQQPETIHVYHDGTRFTHVTQSHIWFKAQASVECKRRTNLKLALLTSDHVTTPSGVLGPAPGTWGAVEVNGRQSAYKASLAQLFAPPRKNPAELCNLELEKRVTQGESRFGLLRDGFDLLMQWNVGLVANCQSISNDTSGTGPNTTPAQWPAGWWEDGWGSAGTVTHSFIRCEGGHAPGSLTTPTAPPRPASDDFAIPFQVTKATLAVQPSRITADCPATLTATGSIAVAGEGTVKYRVEHNGALGPVQEMHFGKGDRKGKGLSFQFQVGADQAGGELGKTNGPAGGGGPIGGFTQGAQPSNQVSGSMRLIIVAPKAGKDHSNPTAFTVVCRPPRPGSLTPTPTPTTRPPGPGGEGTPIPPPAPASKPPGHRLRRH